MCTVTNQNASPLVPAVHEWSTSFTISSAVQDEQLGRYSMVVMVDKHCYHRHTDSLLWRTHNSEASKVSKLFTQSQEGLCLTFQFVSTTPSLVSSETEQVFKSKEKFTMWKVDFPLAFCKQPMFVNHQIKNIQLYRLDRTPHHYVYTWRHSHFYVSPHKYTACWASKHILPEIWQLLSVVLWVFLRKNQLPKQHLKEK